MQCTLTAGGVSGAGHGLDDLKGPFQAVLWFYACMQRTLAVGGVSGAVWYTPREVCGCSARSLWEV